MRPTHVVNSCKLMDGDFPKEDKKKAYTLKSLIPKFFNCLQTKKEQHANPNGFLLRKSSHNVGDDLLNTAETDWKSPNEHIQMPHVHQLEGHDMIDNGGELELLNEKMEALGSLDLSDTTFQKDEDTRPYKLSAPFYQNLDKLRENTNLNKLFQDISLPSSLNSNGDPLNTNSVNLLKLVVIGSMEESVPEFFGDNITITITEINEQSSEEEYIDLSEIRELAGDIIFSDDDREQFSLSAVDF